MIKRLSLLFLCTLFAGIMMAQEQANLPARLQRTPEEEAQKQRKIDFPPRYLPARFLTSLSSPHLPSYLSEERPWLPLLPSPDKAVLHNASHHPQPSRSICWLLFCLPHQQLSSTRQGSPSVLFSAAVPQPKTELRRHNMS